jgi:Ca-activated chloride channel family protein
VKRLAPQDRFNLVEFDTDFTMFSPVPVDPAKIDESETNRWLERLAAEGGTKLLPALEATLTQPDDPDRHRMIVVVTDGILSDEQDVLHVLEKSLGEGRLFVVGTGKQIRQETLLRLAEYGRGAAAFAGDAQSLESAVTELFDSIADPLGWDVRLDFAGAEIEETVPSRLPDLYAGRPVRVLAWFRDELPSQMLLRMATTEGERLYEVKLPPRLP